MELQITKELILKDFKLKDEDVLNIYPFGSRVYGTHSYQSDHDFVIVMKGGAQDLDSLSSSYNNLNATVYSQASFLEKIGRHVVSVMECVSLPSTKLIKNSYQFQFSIHLPTLRESISAKASHSWVKAHKKFEVPQDRNVYTAKKSLFHSLRIINFGIQIATHGKIIDYSSCTQLWLDILSNPAENWAEYGKLYKNKYNNDMTSFRRLAHK